MILDFHLHTTNSAENYGFDEIRRMMRENGVDKAVIFPMKQGSSDELMRRNLENAKEEDKDLLPFLRLDPKSVRMDDFLEISGKFYGFKLHPRAENFDPFSSAMEPFFEEIARQHKPVIIHSRKENNQNTDPDRLVSLADVYQGINFVFGHFANDSEVFFSKLVERKNAYVETSIVSSPRIIEMRVKQAGCEKILFGSDFPYSDQEIELLKIRKARLTDYEKNRILYVNAETLLGLQG